MPTSRRVLAAFLLVLLLLGAAGCRSGGTDAPPETDPEAGETAQEEEEFELPQLYLDPATGLAVRLPEDWIAALMDDAVVALLSPLNGEEDFFQENVVITADDQFPDLTMPAYLEALEYNVRQIYGDTQTLESGELEIDSLPAHWQVDAFTSAKGPARVYRVVIIREQVAYVFHATALEYTFDRYRPLFEAIAASIHWPPPEAAGETGETGEAGEAE